MKYILLIILSITLFSCSLEHRLGKYCPMCKAKYIHDTSYVNKIVYKDKVIFVNEDDYIIQLENDIDSYLSTINDLQNRSPKKITKWYPYKQEIDSVSIYNELKSKEKPERKVEFYPVYERYVPISFWVLSFMLLVVVFLAGYKTKKNDIRKYNI